MSAAVEIASRSDPGRDPDKQINEDAVAFAETHLGLLAVVCDGMGGHAGGKEAAEIAVKAIFEGLQSPPRGVAARDALREAIEEANRRVWAMTTVESGLRPGSTVVAVLFHEGGAEIAHVGDSRVYLVHRGAILQMTKDHSMVQEMVDRNIIRAEDAPKHPDANKIMRALGIAKDCEVDVRPEPVAYVAGDVFVLCSDGLSDLVAPAEILEVAGSQPAAQAAGQLIDLANARGGHDNVTALVVRMKATAAASAAPTIVKTMPLTRGPDDPVAEAPVAGPRGTLLAAPAQPPSASSTRTVASPPEAPLPSYGARPRSDRPSRTVTRPPIVLGVVLAAIALTITAVVVWLELRPQHHVSVPIVDAAAGTAAPSADDGDAPTPDILPAPPLPTAATFEAGAPGEPVVCRKARSARARSSPAAAALAEQCRAAGGVP